MNSTVQQLKDEFTELSSARFAWEAYWRDIAKFVLPQTPNFDDMLASSVLAKPMNAVVDTPVAAGKSPAIYDMTSLWAIERLSAGLLTLKTPESSFWHEMSVESDFGYEPTHDEEEALERLRNYLFKMRSNPHSGFWPAHKAAIRSMCAFGDGWLFVEEQMGKRVPVRYEYIPLSTIYAAVGQDGRPNRAFRPLYRSAVQIMEKWPECKHQKVIDYANDPKKKHERFVVLHSVVPRPDGSKIGRIGTRAAQFASYYCLPEENYMIGESGYFEFPFTRYAWSSNGNSAYSEGPVAIALGEVKSMQEMSKNELLASQMVLRPPLATYGKNMQRLNFNAGQTNPGLINGDGRPLFAPLNAGVRPDFAQTIMESRRNNLKELLYLNLWQILIDSPEMTATEALIRAQEKGELLGPVGLSLNGGLSTTTDREVGILGRNRAFEEGKPLAMPESLSGKNVAPIFTSPLDRLRRVGELIGIQRLLEIGNALAPMFPSIKNRFDPDDIIEKAQDILGAPASVLVSKDKAAETTQVEEQQTQAMMAAQGAEASGRAMQALGEGGRAAAEGAEAAGSSQGLQRLLQNLGIPVGAPQGQ